MMAGIPPAITLEVLTLTGPEVSPAKLEFAQGLNVIDGPSDTGKTYIAQCIDFMLGSGTPPKNIPEADGYDTASLSIKTGHGKTLVFERSLKGGAFRLHHDGETTVLREKHAADREDTVSHRLLMLSGLTNKKVRKNSRGTTRTLSFRDIARLVIVSEEDIIAARSPILSGQRGSKTEEKSVFRLLLTGMDDSSLIEHEEPKVVRSKQQGKKELLQELLEKNAAEIASAEAGEIAADMIPSAIAELDQTLGELNAALATQRGAASELETERKTAWQALRQTESREAVLLELQKRFKLLQTQYASDLRRLEAIGEAGVRLAQLTEERCPVCGAVAEHHDEVHRQAHASPQDVAMACGAEAEKIQILTHELEITIQANAEQLEHIREQLRLHKASLNATQVRLREEMQPRIGHLVDDIRSAEQARARLIMLADLYRRRDELSKMLMAAEAPVRRATKHPSASVGTDEAEEFSKVVEELLRTWNFPNLGRVTFSEDDQDIIISGRRRSSHGKGVRALTHAAFTLALLRYCRRDGRPHPGFVLIDSPLIVYREPEGPEAGEIYHVKDAFYHNVATDFATEQVIILENEAPPNDLVRANLVHFTGGDHGRKSTARACLPYGQRSTTARV